MAEKTEKPTDKRRKDSAKKGKTFKSKDLTTTLCLVSGVYFISHLLSFKDFISLYTLLMFHNSEIRVNDFLLELMFVFFRIVLPVIVILSVVGIAMTLLQTRFSIATEAIKLNFKALNPVEGVKKIFSMRTLKEFVKSICYLVVFTLVCYFLVKNDLKKVLSVVHAGLHELVFLWVSLAFKSVMVFITFSLVILIADFIVEYFLHFKDLKMDKHEVKRERKENDGNPEIKGARRRIHHEILSGEEMSAIRNSEVVMANPTHIAIAIYFNPEVAMLPFIALRTTHQKAKAAIAYAEKIGVPVVRDIPLTRRIYKSYRQYSFISLDDDVLMKIMNILIWLRQVEVAGMDISQETENEFTENDTGVQ
ncbi:EscU/YscU/HrcU family type III secretion system export apparatus switch protein [Citrobacter sp. JGM124]|uniref:EscU/YscU/HrcU family type III secretion system export apparatus switch protein n=1 Tax=Citrobacter sp. JGM124 TaxID=2799789 RepID=UPI001BAB3E94|nr:EscU/YscU/HrcU family type III secretion system export apparatus switch protein [Citrobacter sp. JGM124]MBS0846928.1 EscU/YscU/HrcU family type III secretion system export apparatus switch protein [Citrobacter sp. JGM124]